MYSSTSQSVSVKPFALELEKRVECLDLWDRMFFIRLSTLFFLPAPVRLVEDWSLPFILTLNLLAAIFIRVRHDRYRRGEPSPSRRLRSGQIERRQ